MVRFVKCLQHKTISRRFSTIQLNLPKCKFTDNLIIVQSYIMNRKYKNYSSFGKDTVLLRSYFNSTLSLFL